MLRYMSTMSSLQGCASIRYLVRRVVSPKSQTSSSSLMATSNGRPLRSQSMSTVHSTYRTQHLGRISHLRRHICTIHPLAKVARNLDVFYSCCSVSKIPSSSSSSSESSSSSSSSSSSPLLMKRQVHDQSESRSRNPDAQQEGGEVNVTASSAIGNQAGGNDHPQLQDSKQSTSIWRKILVEWPAKLLPQSLRNQATAYAIGVRLLRSAQAQGANPLFRQVCLVPDKPFSEHALTMLHLWILVVRLRVRSLSDGVGGTHDGRLIEEAVFEALWGQLEAEFVSRFGLPAILVQKRLREYQSAALGGLTAYDRALAVAENTRDYDPFLGALWRNVYGAPGKADADEDSDVEADEYSSVSANDGDASGIGEETGNELFDALEDDYGFVGAEQHQPMLHAAHLEALCRYVLREVRGVVEGLDDATIVSGDIPWGPPPSAAELERIFEEYDDGYTSDEWDEEDNEEFNKRQLSLAERFSERIPEAAQAERSLISRT